ncbi:MAG: hypothetical protein ACI89X_003684 [Planctomycetota bacterium]|jgi:hypothetical protein
MAVHTVKDGTDVAMMALWDLGLEPVTPRPSIDGLKQEVDAARLSIVSTGSDGSFDVVIAVDEELPEEHRLYMEPTSGPCLLHAATGRLCWGSTEFYRTPKADKFSDSQVLTVAPGDYAIRWFEPASLPRREFVEYLGEQRYAMWLVTERQGKTSGCILAAMIVLAVFGGAAADWRLGLGIFAMGAVFLVLLSWLRDSREPGRKELPELEFKFAARTGHDVFAEVEEAFFEGKPQFGIELRRLEHGESGLVGGWASEAV